MNKIIIKLAFKHLAFGNPHKALALLSTLDINAGSSPIEIELYILSSFQAKHYAECAAMMNHYDSASGINGFSHFDDDSYQSIKRICKKRISSLEKYQPISN